MAHFDRPRFATATDAADWLRVVKPRGSRTGYRLEREQVQSLLAEGMTPLQFLSAVYRDEEVPLELRIEAAKAAAPYVHRKQPQSVEIRNLCDMTDDELLRLANLAPIEVTATRIEDVQQNRDSEDGANPDVRA